MSYHRYGGFGLEAVFNTNPLAVQAATNPLATFKEVIAQEIVHEPERIPQEPTVLPSREPLDPLATFSETYVSRIEPPAVSPQLPLMQFEAQHPMWDLNTGLPLNTWGDQAAISDPLAHETHAFAPESYQPGMQLPGAPGAEQSGIPSSPARPCQTPAGPVASYPNASAFGTACISSGGQISPQGICTLKNGAKLMLGPGGCPTFVTGAGGAPVAKKSAVGTMAIVGVGLAALLLLK